MGYNTNENSVEVAGRKTCNEKRDVSLKTNTESFKGKSVSESHDRHSIEENNLPRKKHPIIMIIEMTIMLMFGVFCIGHILN